MRELKRQLFHMLFGVAFVLLFYFELITLRHLFLLIIIAILLSFLAQKRPLPGLSWFLHRFERGQDLVLFPGKGLIFYMIGIFFALLIAPLDIALAAIMILAFGDSISHLAGLHLGRTKHPFTDKKNLEGMLAGIVAGFIGAIYFVEWYEALAAAVVAMLIEGIDWKLGFHKIDDNLLIPIGACLIILMIRGIF